VVQKLPAGQERELGLLGKIAHEPLDGEWPPPPPELNKGVFVCGFLKSGRSFRDTRTVDFEAMHFGLVADRVDGQMITCQFHREEWLDASGSDTLGGQFDMGGMSGAPLWALIQRRGVHSWRLAGIVIQFSDDYELLYARRPTAIKADGHVAA
jgi:hypothetical protein